MTLPEGGNPGSVAFASADQPPPPDVDGDLARRVQRRTLRVVILGQVLGGAGLAAGATVGALLAEQMLGTESLAGLPTALYTLGSAGTAYAVGQVSQRAGRRVGLGAGFTLGGVGAMGVVLAAAVNSVPLLLVSLLVYGAGTATNLQARYAGTDLAPADRRATAVSIALVSTTFGAVAGPNLVGPLGRVATSLSLPALTGPFLLAAVAYLAAGAVLFTMLRPDPLLLARELSARTPSAGVADTAVASTRPVTPAIGRTAYVGATIMILTQITMVAIMTMTPVYMRDHHHGLSDVGLVISVHIAAMYLPSPLTGILVDRIGRTAMAAAAGVVLLCAGITAAAVPGGSMTGMLIALALLGLGWNLGLISGTALVVEGTVPTVRARVQGAIDVLVALTGAGSGAVSGLVVSAVGFSVLTLGGGILALVLVPALVWSLRSHEPTTATRKA